jgi:hypothetical protein
VDFWKIINRLKAIFTRPLVVDSIRSKAGEEIQMAQSKSGDLIVVAIDVTKGKITKVKGVELDR